MTARILVPLDGTPEAASALPLARTLAHAFQGEVVLVTALAKPGGHGPAVEDAEPMLDAVARELRPSVPVSTVSLAGEPAEVVCRAAKEQEARLVVMATHGRVGLNRAFAGSVAEGVLVNSPVPIVLLRPGGVRATSISHLLVPVDGTTGGALALGAAVDLARATGATLHLLEVTVPIPVWAMSDPYGGVYIDPSWDDEALASADTYVKGVAARLQAQGIKADGRSILAPNVAGTIIKVADEVQAELIVMATHAHTGPIRTILGSVADQLVREAHRPIFLLRRDEAAPSTSVAPAPSSTTA